MSLMADLRTLAQRRPSEVARMLPPRALLAEMERRGLAEHMVGDVWRLKDNERIPTNESGAGLQPDAAPEADRRADAGRRSVT